jgi:hypothetical protein
MADAMVDDDDDVAFVIAFIICVELSKAQEYPCEYCDKVYKQEARYMTHMKVCVEKDTAKGCVEKDTHVPPIVAAQPMLDNTTVMELLRQNGEMLDLLRKQQETIQMLVAERMG